MIDFKNNIKCIGCGACADKCPTKCICMTENNEGFLYPDLINDTCVNCGQCEEVCPLTGKTDERNSVGYAAYNLNSNIRESSSSGGIFALLAESILKAGGVVCGAAFDSEFVVRHRIVDNSDDLRALYGSKYVQSDTTGIFKKIKKYLDADSKVLFTGTPCQISALKSFLGKDYQRLYCQGVVCHGTPSPGLWRAYLKELESKNSSKIKSVNFRDKVKGWKNFSFTSEFENGHCYSNVFNEDVYMQMFLKNFSLRKSCYDCSFKIDCVDSDILLADFWGIDNVVSGMNDNRGASLVIVNTDKGAELFDNIKDSVCFKEINIKDTLPHNPALVSSVKEPKNRSGFFTDVFAVGIEKAHSKYTKSRASDRIRVKIKWYFYKLKRMFSRTDGKGK